MKTDPERTEPPRRPKFPSYSTRHPPTCSGLPRLRSLPPSGNRDQVQRTPGKLPKGLHTRRGLRGRSGLLEASACPSERRYWTAQGDPLGRGCLHSFPVRGGPCSRDAPVILGAPDAMAKGSEVALGRKPPEVGVGGRSRTAARHPRPRRPGGLRTPSGLLCSQTPILTSSGGRLPWTVPSTRGAPDAVPHKSFTETRGVQAEFLGPGYVRFSSPPAGRVRAKERGWVCSKWQSRPASSSFTGPLPGMPHPKPHTRWRPTSFLLP